MEEIIKLLKDIKEGLNEWRNISCFQIKTHKIVDMAVIPTFKYSVQISGFQSSIYAWKSPLHPNK